MSGDQDRSSHPARKVDRQELKQFLADKREDVPALTSRVVAQEFSEVKPKTVKNNLEALADNEEICRFNDGDVLLWWYPRKIDDAGDVPHSEIFDDSIDYSDINPAEVPQEIAEEIASERIPYYRPRSFWSETKNIGQMGIMLSLGLIILGVGELVSSSLGLQQETAGLILQIGFFSAVFTTGIYVVILILDLLASYGYVSRDPFPVLRTVFR